MSASDLPPEWREVVKHPGRPPIRKADTLSFSDNATIAAQETGIRKFVQFVHKQQDVDMASKIMLNILMKRFLESDKNMER